MRLSRNQIIGYIILFIGISIFLGVLGLGIFLGPLLFAGAGIFFIRKNHRWIGIFCFVLALIVLFEAVLHINIGGLLIAGFFIYFGYQLLVGGEVPFMNRKKWKNKQKHVDDDFDEDWLDREIDALKQEFKKDKKQANENEEVHDEDVNIKTPKFRSSIIGDFHLINHRFELDDMNLSTAIGDVKIDLSKAIIPEGETTISISGMIGDIDIYVPYDLDVSVAGSVTLGELRLFGHKQSGIGRQVNLASKDYKQATRKVKISVSLLIGEVDVRYL